MPSYGYLPPCEVDPQRWRRCKKQATDGMVAAGWKTYARKFDEVMRRKAIKLWNAGS